MVKQTGWFGRHWKVLATLGVLLLFFQEGLLVLAVLLVLSPPLRTQTAAVAVLAGGLGLTWLLHPGELHNQVWRAGTVLALAVFVPATFYTKATVTHRILLAGTTAAVGVLILCAATGLSWGELRWWVERGWGRTAQIFMSGVWYVEGGTGAAGKQLRELFDSMIGVAADYFPARTTLQVMTGLAFATIAYRHLATVPRGVAPGPFREIRFTEHLGWAAIVLLVVVLVPKLAAAKLGAMNVLLVFGALYALRGVAVFVVGFHALGGGCLNAVLFSAAAFLLLPLAFIGAILLGIVDTSFDLRRRWARPPAGG